MYGFAPNTFGWVDLLGLYNDDYDEYSDHYFLESFGDFLPLNVSKSEFAYHGKWCGPGWTAGKHESYSKNNDTNSYYHDPISSLDSACKIHDICYAQCRESHPCGGINKKSCMDRCDNELVISSNNIKNDVRGTSLTRDVLSKIISKNLGGDSNKEPSCKR